MTNLDEERISKTMAYLLRHEPSGLDISKNGFVDLEELMDELKNRWEGISRKDVRRIVEEDPKGRYEIKNGEIRARYGHSIDVDPSLEKSSEETLYHGTTKKALDKIMDEGLKPRNRKKVHLSSNIEEAEKVGRRRTDNPIILKVDVEGARRDGIDFEKASDRVFVSEEIPAKYISVIDK